jgi:hypothetical protein
MQKKRWKEACILQKTALENPSRTSVVCVDSYDNGVLAGRIISPHLSAEVAFHSTMEFIKEIESLLGEMQFPQSFSTNRSFRPLSDLKTTAFMPSAAKKGQVATFFLRILFRQNASWQGSVTWMENGRSESFRSALELIFLTDSALREVRAS